MRNNKLLIFQIGFNKCGTRSLFHFFKDNGIPSVHYDGGKIAQSMFLNDQLGKRLISPRYNKISFFSDMENVSKASSPQYVAQDLFKKLAKQYPNAYFLLNTRNRDNWIKSRINHGNGSYLKEIAEKNISSEEEVVADWMDEWDDHHGNVRDFFKDQPNRLIEYNIENEDIGKIIKFFNQKEGLNLKRRYYKHFGKTKINNDVSPKNKVNSKPKIKKIASF